MILHINPLKESLRFIMALRGDLRDFSITQLLNLVNLAHKTGTLVVEGPGQTAKVAFRSGKLAYAETSREENGLAAILLKAKKLAQSQYQSIQQRAAHISDKELGLLLINSGHLTQESILSDLQQHYTDIIQHLFTWVEGSFHFDNELLPPEDRICIRLDLENLIIDGSRQMREWEQLQDEIPSLDMALKFTDRPATNLKKISLNVEEWRVVSYINPHNTLQQIASTTKKTDLEIRRIVYGLLQAGLVEVIRPDGAAPLVPFVRAFPTDDKEEQKSLVNRLINRIRSL
ncbi:MAG: DUF4388 domain-containing protein [Chloroflexota bacterium]